MNIVVLVKQVPDSGAERTLSQTDRTDLDDLFPDTGDAGFRVTRTRVVEAVPRPARAAGIRITDDGSAGLSLAAYLIAQKLF